MTTVNSSAALSSLLSSYYDNTLSTLTTATTSTTSTSTSTLSTSTTTTSSTESLKTKLLLQSQQIGSNALSIMTGKSSYGGFASIIDDYADISEEAQKLLSAE